MMDRLFDIAAARHEEITKAAFVAPLLRAGMYALKNPLKTLGGALTAQQVSGDAQKMMGMAGRGMPGIVPKPTSTF